MYAKANSKKTISQNSIRKMTIKMKKEDEEDLQKYYKDNYNGLDGDTPFPMPKKNPDFNGDFQTDLDELELVLKNHNLSLYEIRMIFNLIDINKDGAINFHEWDNFKRLFFDPWEKECDGSGNWLIEYKEMKDCLANKAFIFLSAKEIKDQYQAEVMTVLGNENEEVNFAGYLYLRRTALGWRECVPGKEKLSRGYFKCATDIATMGHTLALGDLDAAFNVALLQNGLAFKTVTINYTQFLRICWVYNLFLALDQPVAEGAITQREMRKAIDNGMLPKKLTQNMVTEIYRGLDEDATMSTTIHFPTFVILDMFYDKWFASSIKGKGNDYHHFCTLMAMTY